MNKPDYKEEELAKPVTLGTLLEFTDDFLLPKMGEMIDEMTETFNSNIEKSNAGLEHRLKIYIDDKMADYTSDIFKRLDKKYQKESQFKNKVVELFKKNKIGTSEDIAFLEGLAVGE